MIIEIKKYKEPYFSLYNNFFHLIPKLLRPKVSKLFFIKQDKYDCVFSMGDLCPTAFLLRELGVRSFSSPFDWIAGKDIFERFDLLESDFSGFFNKEDFVVEFVEKKKRDAYRGINNRTGWTFPHDFQKADLDQVWPEFEEKYSRRIKRLKQRVYGQRVLLVYTSKKEKLDGKKISKVLNKYKENFSIKSLDLLFIQLGDSVDNPDCLKKMVLSDSLNLYLAEINPNYRDLDWLGHDRRFPKIFGEILFTVLED